MATTILNQTITTTYNESISQPSLTAKFMNWCKNQQFNRLLWVGAALTTQGCILAPITLTAVFLAGTNMFLFMSGIISIMLVLVTNLAAMPTKITIPAFILSILIDIAVIIACVASGLGAANIF